jgi:hypothetical protein
MFSIKFIFTQTDLDVSWKSIRQFYLSFQHIASAMCTSERIWLHAQHKLDYKNKSNRDEGKSNCKKKNANIRRGGDLCVCVWSVSKWQTNIDKYYWGKKDA